MPPGPRTADVLVDGETIAAVLTPGSSLLGVDLEGSVDSVVDATGKYVIPGGIDAHTHMELPFGGTAASDTFETGTRAAAWGGTTTIIDFAVQTLRRAGRGRPGRLARQGRGQLRHRLRVPPDHRRRRRVQPQGDGHPDRRGRHQLQAVHGVPGGLLRRRRAGPSGHAEVGRDRAADHDARRERPGHRRAGRAALLLGQDRPLLPRHRPGLADGGGGHPSGDHDRAT